MNAFMLGNYGKIIKIASRKYKNERKVPWRHLLSHSDGILAVKKFIDGDTILNCFNQFMVPGHPLYYIAYKIFLNFGEQYWGVVIKVKGTYKGKNAEQELRIKAKKAMKSRGLI